MCRYLAQAVIHDGRVYRQSLVSIDSDGRVVVEPFMGEVHSTIYVSGIIVVAPAERISTAQIAHMKHIVGREELPEMAIKRIVRYVGRMSLQLMGGDTPQLIIIQR